MRLTWPQYDGVRQQSRLFPATGTQEQVRALELVTLLSAGVFAATFATFVDFSLRIPGHSIIRAIFPMALGLAVAPRRGAGCVMGGTAIFTAMFFQWGGFGSMGFGAMTSLCVTGPMLDGAIYLTRGGKRIYLGLALAGLASNGLAFLVRGGIKYAGADHATGRLLAFWAPQAAVTYTLCGLAAGLISAAAWFKFRKQS